MSGSSEKMTRTTLRSASAADIEFSHAETMRMSERLAMTELEFEEIAETPPVPIDPDGEPEFRDLGILCIDCAQEFIWTAGEQTFFRDKQLQNPPKRCKECKKAKNRRLEAIEIARITGKRQKIEVRAECARCSVVTTVPFYPCQGRPVYCRDCFGEMGNGSANSAYGHA